MNQINTIFVNARDSIFSDDVYTDKISLLVEDCRHNNCIVFGMSDVHYNTGGILYSAVISIHEMFLNYNDMFVIKQIILHEFAHVIHLLHYSKGYFNNYKAHDTNFKNIATNLGIHSDFLSVVDQNTLYGHKLEQLRNNWRN